MRWYRKAQIALFGVFAVVLLTLAWGVLPVTELSVGGKTAFVFDRVIYTAVALVLAGLLAAAAGGESDFNEALRSKGIASVESFDANKALIYWMRIGAIAFLLAPFVLLAVESEGHLTPLTDLYALLGLTGNSQSASVFALLYNSVYGLCVTLLAIDFFLTPLTAQIMRTETSFATKDKLANYAADICSRFLGAIKTIGDQNVPELRGASQVWTTLTAFTTEVDTAKQSVTIAAAFNTEEKQAIVARLTAVQDAMAELIEFPKFLRGFDPSNARSGIKQFKRVANDDMGSALNELLGNLSAVYGDCKLEQPLLTTQTLGKLTKNIEQSWTRICSDARAHYKLPAVAAPRPELADAAE
ncbi:MAG: hypothetical protein HOP13_19665 [Alphaproteobacteria bacterium]|nr:hypothetical protein [Alphaproteobacteria bacterium]